MREEVNVEMRARRPLEASPLETSEVSVERRVWSPLKASRMRAWSCEDVLRHGRRCLLLLLERGAGTVWLNNAVWDRSRLVPAWPRHGAKDRLTITFTSPT